MLLTEKTIAVIKNFSLINPSLEFKEGFELETISPSKTIRAYAKVDIEFKGNFAIYDLNKLLNAISLVGKSPNIEFHEKYLSISGNGRFDITYSNPELIIRPQKSIRKLQDDIRFVLTADALKATIKAAGALGCSVIAFVGNGERIFLETFDPKNPTSDKFQMDIGQTSMEFKVLFEVDNLKLLPGDYDVTIDTTGIALFLGQEHNVKYWVAIRHET